MNDFDVTRFAGASLLVVGDFMIDEYVRGMVSRISPEAPVPILAVTDESFTLGGAGNVVNNLAALSARVVAAGVVGTGENGRLLRRLFSETRVDTEGLIVEEGRLTTRKTRIIAEHQQVLRIDRETTRRISPKSRQAIIDFANARMPEIDAVILSDYAKGLISRPLVEAVVSSARRRGVPVVCDPKSRDFSLYNGVTLLTPNRREAAAAAGISTDTFEDVTCAGRRILQNTRIDNLLITCGKDGMMLFENKDPVAPRRIAADARQVFDVSGAGDTVVSVMGLCGAVDMSWPEAAAVANAAAGVVVGKVGTAVVTPKELSAALLRKTGDIRVKQVLRDDLSAYVKRLRGAGRRIVLTNGCFDFLHVGHFRFLSAARALGDVLIVAVDDDASVIRLKGPGRPVIGETERVRILSALDCVDAVVVFPTDGLYDLIDTVRPDVLAKGDNYDPAEVVGRERVEARGGRVVLLPVLSEITTAGLIKAVRGENGGASVLNRGKQ